MAKGDLDSPGSLCRVIDATPTDFFKKVLGQFIFCFIREDKMLKVSGMVLGQLCQEFQDTENQ